MSFQDSLHRRGVIGTLHLGFLRLFNFQKTPAYLLSRMLDLRRYDREHGVDTAGLIELDRLDIESPGKEHGTRYSGAAPWQFKEGLDQIPIDHGDYTFIDIGSGKGSALFQASDYPFKAIIGVEFARALHEAALRNIATFRSRTQRCRNLTAICEDAASYRYPAGPWVLFFNSPFALPVWKSVAENIARSPRGPKTSYLIFMNYGWNAGAVEFVDSLSFLEPFRRGDTTAIYRFAPE